MNNLLCKKKDMMRLFSSFHCEKRRKLQKTQDKSNIFRNRKQNKHKNSKDFYSKLGKKDKKNRKERNDGENTKQNRK